MKKSTSRLLSTLLVLCMVLALLPAAALAANDDTVEFGFTYYTSDMTVHSVSVDGSTVQPYDEDSVKYNDGTAQILQYYKVGKAAKIVINCAPVDPSMWPGGNLTYEVEPFTSATQMYPEEKGISVSKRADSTYDITVQLYEDRFGKVTEGSPNDWLLEWQANGDIWDETGNVYTGDIYVVGAFMVLYADEPTEETPDAGTPDTGTATFADVPAGTWFSDAVNNAAAKGLVTGVGNNEYNPGGDLHRVEFVTMIVRLVNGGEPDSVNGAWYEKYYTYANAHNLFAGIGVNDGPTGLIPRYEMAQMIYNAAKVKGLDTSASKDFTDSDRSYGTAYDTAIRYAYATGLLTGRTGGDFAGASTLARAEAATVIWRFYQLANAA